MLRSASLLSLILLLFAMPWGALADDTDKAAEKEAQAKAEADAAQDARDKDPLAGHSSHGEAFNEGARQAAYLMGNTGNVHLEVTTANPQVQQFFDQGLGQLHGFWYFEAERSFRQAAAMDPDCAMNYWGMAMANFTNETRAKGFFAKALELKGKASRREQLWIDALDKYLNGKGDKKTRYTGFIKGLEAVQYEFPEEIEATALLAWAVWRGSSYSQPFTSHLSVDALIQDVFDKNPMHPVHHYRIHLWDYEKPERALASAARCGQAAPTIAHMWHMPGHIYWRLKRYQDSAFQQEASARADHAHMMRDHVMPYQIHNYAHNNEWLTRSLSNIGRVHDAIDLAKNMIELPRHPKQNSVTQRGSRASYGRDRLLEVLYRWELWDQTLALAGTPYLEATDNDGEQINRIRAVGRAHLSTGNVTAGEESLKDLQTRLEKLKEEQDKAGEEAAQKAKDDKKNDKDIEKAKTDARKKFDVRVRTLDAGIKELQGRLDFAQENYEAALKVLQSNSGVLKEHLALMQLAANEKDKAEQTARAAVKSGENQVHPLATLVEVLYRLDKPAETRAEFDKLRALASDADLNTPPLARLNDIARQFEYPDDWRLPRETPADVDLPRPPLDSIGPFRWQPSAAEDWRLPTHDGDTVALSDYRGRPVLVIFYLGYGCLHCAEQIDKFAPLAEKYRQAGIELVAISTDDVKDLGKSIERYEKEVVEDGSSAEPRTFPFPLASDSKLEVFKKYRVFDDFEHAPLHGTFLIDAGGHIRWQDISYDPFMEADFLLEECQRLLSPAVTEAACIKPAGE